MARYQINLAYDGTHYQGFQKQARAVTVQGVFEDALRHLEWKGTSILAAGRTDTGVHASGQVVAFDLDWKHSPDALLAALNAHLPRDIAVQTATCARDDFHPRFDAVSRCYRYRIFCQAVRNPLLERYAWRVWTPVDQSQMNEASRALIGAHDFASFGSAPRRGGSTRRTVLGASWSQVCSSDSPVQLNFEISADAFLYHMVRSLVHLLVRIGQAELGVEAVWEHLSQPGVDVYQGLAPAQGLTLVSVRYPDPVGNGEMDNN
jgi:tRNA pseudouridine38-40 synthase